MFVQQSSQLPGSGWEADLNKDTTKSNLFTGKRPELSIFDVLY